LKEVVKLCIKNTENWYEDSKQEQLKKKQNLKRPLQEKFISCTTNKSKSHGDHSHESICLFSNDDGDREIPEFIKNDLQNLQNDFFEEDANYSKLGRIRNSIYFIISRAVKFGLDLHFFLHDC
jgi:BRCT domain type II-containing protein